MLLAVPYFAMTYWLTTLLASGAPGWLNLLVLASIWSGIKMLWLGPVSLVQLARVRTQEFAARHHQTKAKQNEHDSEAVLSGTC